MDLLTTLVLGSYAWTTLSVRWVGQKVDKLENNHLAHIEDRLTVLERKVDQGDR